MADPFDITTFDQLLTNSYPDGKVPMLSSTYNKVPNNLTACLLTNYIIKFYPPSVYTQDNTLVNPYTPLYELLVSDTIPVTLTRLRLHVFIGSDWFSFNTPTGSYKINYFDLQFLSKFLDVGGRINNVPEIDIVNLNTFLYNSNMNCASASWMKHFLVQYAQVLRNRTNF